ncbi:DnaJ family domain-containing protein [Geodermatophilus sp. SYSU D00815]
MTERKPRGMSFETWIDQQISQARARGAFEDLAGAGRPLPRRDREQTSYDWALEWARRENGGTDGMLPPGLALRKERDGLPDVVAHLPSEAAVRALVEEFNGRVAAHWRRPADRADAVPGMADLDALLERWRATRPPEPEGVSAITAPEPRRRPRRWFRRRDRG